MQQHKYIVKAAAVLCATAAWMAISCCLGQTQARYENYSQWQAVYHPQEPMLQSDRLAPGGQTVLLGDWQVEAGASRMEAISVYATDGMVEGTLRCVSEQPEYLRASLDRTEIAVGSTGVQLQLTMTPTEAALSLNQPTTASVQVELLPEGKAEPTLWATYQVQLQGVQAQEIEQSVPAALEIVSADTFAWTEGLMMQIRVPAQTDLLQLTMDGTSFPQGTRYMYGGKAYILGRDLPVKLEPQGEEASVLFDFSLLPEPQFGNISLQAKALQQNVVTAAGEISVATTREAFYADLQGVNPVITGNDALSFPICADTSGLVWRLEMLTQTDAGIGYAQSDEQYFLVISVSQGASDSQKQITISNENALAPAGAYRLTLERLQDEQTVSAEEILFYVCY